mgnify:CR=1 FL=1
MAIRFDPEYNAEIRRVVKNFNQKRLRAIKRGFKYIPDKVDTKDIKSRFDNRADLNRELNLLKSFNTGKDESLEVVRTGETGKITKWEMDYLESNLKAAKEFYQRELENAREHLTDRYPVNKRLYIDELEVKLDKLNLDITTLNRHEIETRKTIMEGYLKAYTKKKAGFELWLNRVNEAMRLMGIDEREIKRFNQKWMVLTPRQFMLAYRENKIVERMYDLVQSPVGKRSMKFTTDDEDAEVLINHLMENADQMIEEASKM